MFPRADEALKIAKQFDVSVEYLLTGCSSGNDFSPRVQKIAEECERASDLELTMVEKILDISPPGKNTGVQMTS